jgi:hypothetical protein
MKEQLANYVKSIKILYTALLAGVIVFLSVVAALHLTGSFDIEEFEIDPTIFFVVITFISASSIAAGVYLFNSKMKTVKGKEVDEKFTVYRSSVILRAATNEVACFLFTIAYMFYNEATFLIGAIIAVGLMIRYFPTINRISSELDYNLKDLNY